MKNLLWKEWRENRQSVAWAPLLTAALLAMIAVYNVEFARLVPAQMLDAADSVWMLYAVWLLSAVLCGSSLMAPEIGAGTLQFLSALPIARRRLWTVKCVSGFAAMALCILASAIAFFAVSYLALPFGILSFWFRDRVPDLITDGVYALFLTAPIYAMGTLTTMLVDRTVAALGATTVLTLMLGAAIVAVAHFLDFVWAGVDWGLAALTALSIPALLATSYRTFTQGDTLGAPRSLRLAAPALLIDILIIFIAAALAIVFIIS